MIDYIDYSLSNCGFGNTMFEGGRVELNGNVHISNILPIAIMGQLFIPLR
jgi:hypothetical protein